MIKTSFLPKSLPWLNGGRARAVLHQCAALESRLPSDWILVCIALVFFGGYYLGPAFYFKYPAGFAGLYSSMAESILQRGFLLPESIPYYGPGGMPAAYPPLALYWMALCRSLLKISSFEYLRFAPGVISLVSLIPYYMFSKRLTKSKGIALFACFFLASNLLIYYYQSTAGGAVRAVGFLLSITGLAIFLQPEDGSRFVMGCLTGLLLAATICTHLSFGVFFALSLLIFSIYKKDRVTALKDLVLIYSSGIAFSSVWWMTILHRFGWVVFQNTFFSHNTGNILGIFTTPGKTFSAIFYYLSSAYVWVSSPHYFIFLGIGVLSILIFPFVSSRWPLLTWYGAVLIFIAENERFLAAISAIVCGAGFYFILIWVASLEKSALKLKIAAAASIGVITFVKLSFFYIQMCLLLVPGISSKTEDLAGWIKKNTPADATYLFTSANESKAEWLPFMLQRTPATGHWGGEWIGSYNRQQALLGEIDECEQSSEVTQCIANFLKRYPIEADYIITPREQTQNSPVVETWSLLYQNEDYQVWKP